MAMSEGEPPPVCHRVGGTAARVGVTPRQVFAAREWGDNWNKVPPSRAALEPMARQGQRRRC
jgi:hypothetical protein